MLSSSSRETVTQILSEVGHDAGAGTVAGKLFPLVYDELKALAQRYLRHEQPGHTLQPTALVHEVYLKLVDQTRVQWQGRLHFYAVCAEAMRRILIDHARSRKRAKRGGGWRRISLDPALAPMDVPYVDLLTLHEALEKLAALDERQARIVELRFFAGLTTEEVARILGVSKRTVEGDWTHAKAWLRSEMSKDEP